MNRHWEDSDDFEGDNFASDSACFKLGFPHHDRKRIPIIKNVYGETRLAKRLV